MVPNSLLEVVVFLTLEMTERHIEQVHGHTIDDLEHLLLDACDIFDSDLTLERSALGGWSSINIRGQSKELDFVLKLPCSVSSHNSNLYDPLYDINLYFNKLGIASQPIDKGQLSDRNGTPFIILEYVVGIVHESLTEFSDIELSTLKNCLDTISQEKPPGLRRYQSPSDHVSSWYSLVENHVGLSNASQEVSELVDTFMKIYPDVLSYTDSIGLWAQSFMHGDMWPPNIIFQSGKVRLLDFENSAYGNHLYDLALLIETPDSTLENGLSGIVRPEEMDEVNALRPVAVSYIINWSLERLLSHESGLIEPNLSTAESQSAIIGYTHGKISRLRTILPS